MSSFYEVTAASGTAAAGDESTKGTGMGRLSRESSRRRPHPHAGASAAAVACPTRPTGSLPRRPAYRTHTAQQPQRRYTEVARPGLEAFYVRAAERSVVRWRLYRNSRSVSSSGPFVGPQTIDKDS